MFIHSLYSGSKLSKFAMSQILPPHTKGASLRQTDATGAAQDDERPERRCRGGVRARLCVASEAKQPSEWTW